MKIGFGYDIHPLVENRPLIIGGVKIPFHKGLQGHSDADVLAHAVADALLGAAGLGDIGEHFPDTDPEYKDYNSMLLLKEVEKKDLLLNALQRTIDRMNQESGKEVVLDTENFNSQQISNKYRKIIKDKTSMASTRKLGQKTF